MQPADRDPAPVGTGHDPERDLALVHWPGAAASSDQLRRGAPTAHVTRVLAEAPRVLLPGVPVPVVSAFNATRGGTHDAADLCER